MVTNVVSARLDVQNCLQGSLWFCDLVVLITRFGCQFVETSQLTAQLTLRPRFAMSIVLAILLRTVAALVVLGFSGIKLQDNLLLIFINTWTSGVFWDASGKHTPFALFCSEAGPLTDVFIL